MKKILFISNGTMQDYMCDMVLHGLISKGYEVDTTNDMWYLYQGLTKQQLSKLYGKGFTLYGKLEKKATHKSLFQTIRNIFKKEYDFIFFGSVWRDLSLLRLVLWKYKQNEIFFIDGEDHTKIKHSLISKGFYFKRELTSPIHNVFSISFCIPKELILSKIPVKEKVLASVIPGLKQTYLFENEADYYHDYQKSLFAITCKKGGWDCMRHYEILANGCIPYFPDLKNCPDATMANFPKTIILETNKIFESQIKDLESFKEYVPQLINYTKKHLTTENLVDYIFSIKFQNEKI